MAEFEIHENCCGFCYGLFNNKWTVNARKIRFHTNECRYRQLHFEPLRIYPQFHLRDRIK